MGHVVNPLSTRIRINTFWDPLWTTYKDYNYRQLTKEEYALNSFFNWFKKSEYMVKSPIYIYDLKSLKITSIYFFNYFYFNFFYLKEFLVKKILNCKLIFIKKYFP